MILEVVIYILRLALRYKYVVVIINFPKVLLWKSAGSIRMTLNPVLV